MVMSTVDCSHVCGQKVMITEAVPATVDREEETRQDTIQGE